MFCPGFLRINAVIPSAAGSVDKQSLSKNILSIICIIVVCLAIVVVLAVYQSRPRLTFTVPDLPPRAKPADNQAVPAAKAPRSEEDSRFEAYISNQIGAGLEKSTVPKRILEVTSYGVMLPVALRWQLACAKIDRDLVIEDIKKKNVTDVLLTIEPLVVTDSGFKQISQFIPLDGFFTSAHMVFTLPSVPEFTHLGLFLCSDASHTGRCSGKQLFDVISDKEELHPAQPEVDHIYYFSHLILVRHNMFSPAYFAAENPVPRPGSPQPPFTVLFPARSKEGALRTVSEINHRLMPIPLAVDKPCPTIILPISTQECLKNAP